MRLLALLPLAATALGRQTKAPIEKIDGARGVLFSEAADSLKLDEASQSGRRRGQGLQ